MNDAHGMIKYKKIDIDELYVDYYKLNSYQKKEIRKGLIESSKCKTLYFDMNKKEFTNNQPYATDGVYGEDFVVASIDSIGYKYVYFQYNDQSEEAKSENCFGFDYNEHDTDCQTCPAKVECCLYFEKNRYKSEVKEYERYNEFEIEDVEHIYFELPLSDINFNFNINKKGE